MEAKKLTKWTLELAKEFYASKGCELLAVEYKDMKTKMPFLCHCGEMHDSTLGQFRISEQCKDCGKKKANENASKSKITKGSDRRSELTIKAREEFELEGCSMLSDYVNVRTPIDYVCSCGNKSTIHYNNFKAGQRCKRCAVHRTKDKNSDIEKPVEKVYDDTYQKIKWTLEQTKEFYESKGCELLATEYTTNSAKMPFLCHCGTIHESTLGQFQTSSQCLTCARRQAIENSTTSNQVRLSEYRDEMTIIVGEEFEKEGCSMLSNYVNMDDSIRYICSCGNESAIQYKNFIIGQRCQNCMTDRRRETNIERFGVINAMKVPEIDQRRRNTLVANTGYDYPICTPERQEKRRITMLERYGVEHYMQSEQGKLAIQNTMLERYGYRHPAQVAEFRSKSLRTAFGTKSWTSPSGKIFKYQGYELEIIQLLISNGIDELDILTEDELLVNDIMPVFMYNFEDKQHRYYPDIYIKSLNKFIEVKSTWTFGLHLEQVLAKADCIYFSGYDMEIYVLDDKKIIVEHIVY